MAGFLFSLEGEWRWKYRILVEWLCCGGVGFRAESTLEGGEVWIFLDVETSIRVDFRDAVGGFVFVTMRWVGGLVMDRSIMRFGGG